MPKIAITTLAISIALTVSGAAPCRAAIGGGPERRSEDGRRAIKPEVSRSGGRAQGAVRASCPPRWPYIVLTCVA